MFPGYMKDKIRMKKYLLILIFIGIFSVNFAEKIDLNIADINELKTTANNNSFQVTVLENTLYKFQLQKSSNM